jgi:hypothetical protein
MIPDIAAKSGIFASDIPILNGSKRANEHFSGTFWQRDTVYRRRTQPAAPRVHGPLRPEMADPVRLGVLKSVFAAPERLQPGTTRPALTAKTAAEQRFLRSAALDRPLGITQGGRPADTAPDIAYTAVQARSPGFPSAAQIRNRS